MAFVIDHTYPNPHQSDDDGFRKRLLVEDSSKLTTSLEVDSKVEEFPSRLDDIEMARAHGIKSHNCLQTSSAGTSHSDEVGISACQSNIRAAVLYGNSYQHNYDTQTQVLPTNIMANHDPGVAVYAHDEHTEERSICTDSHIHNSSHSTSADTVVPCREMLLENSPQAPVATGSSNTENRNSSCSSSICTDSLEIGSVNFQVEGNHAVVDELSGVACYVNGASDGGVFATSECGNTCGVHMNLAGTLELHNSDSHIPTTKYEKGLSHAFTSDDAICNDIEILDDSHWSILADSQMPVKNEVSILSSETDEPRMATDNNDHLSSQEDGIIACPACELDDNCVLNGVHDWNEDDHNVGSDLNIYEKCLSPDIADPSLEFDEMNSYIDDDLLCQTQENLLHSGLIRCTNPLTADPCIRDVPNEETTLCMSQEDGALSSVNSSATTLLTTADERPVKLLQDGSSDLKAQKRFEEISKDFKLTGYKWHVGTRNVRVRLQVIASGDYIIH